VERPERRQWIGTGLDAPSGITAQGEWAVAKSDDAAQQVFGWANISLRKDGQQVTDLQADQIPADELEQSAYQFVVDQGMSGTDHDGGEPNGVLIESMFFSAEKQQALGIPAGTLPVGWWLGFHFPDRAIYDSVVNGERTMFSVEGTAYYEEIEAA
jgi:hypothetical protein